MSRTRPFQTLLWAALVAAPTLVACSSSDESPSPPAPPADVVLEGDATAEQLDAFRTHKPRDWDWAGGQFDAPDDGATLAAETPLTFAWHADAADFAPGGAAGEVVMTHLLLFSTESQAHLLEVFTTLSEYTPDALYWQKLVDVQEPITLSLTTGTFVGSDVPKAGGPYIGQTLTFTIE